MPTKKDDTQTPVFPGLTLADSNASISKAVGYVHMIDRLLSRSAECLSLSQPSMTGKLDIRFWKMKKNADRQPCVFSWKQLKNGRFISEKHQNIGLARLAHRSGGFRYKHEETKEILTRISTLMTLRSKMMAEIGRQNMVLEMMVSLNSSKLDEIGNWLNEKHPALASDRPRWLDEWHKEIRATSKELPPDFFEETGEEKDLGE
jgi:hypothetical protein